jgi:hypothetical protein
MILCCKELCSNGVCSAKAICADASAQNQVNYFLARKKLRDFELFGSNKILGTKTDGNKHFLRKSEKQKFLAMRLPPQMDPRFIRIRICQGLECTGFSTWPPMIRPWMSKKQIAK